MAVATYTKNGNKAATAAKLDKSIFNVSPKNHLLLKAAYAAHLANSRSNVARVKTRGLVSGGGRKPWRQKGTGRARFGSSRNPIWRGGGVAFGPTGEEHYGHKMHVKAKRQAIRQALSLAVDSGKVIVIEDLNFRSGKTTEAQGLLAKIGATHRNNLIVVENKSNDIVKATKNLQGNNIVHARYLNVFDILNADNVILTSGALKAISQWLGGAR